MNESQQNSNSVYLSGTVVGEPIFSHQVFGENFYESALRVNRLSEQADIIPITVSDRLMSDYDLEPGTEIAVSGQFRSYNKLVEGRSKLMLTVFVREIVEAEEGRNSNQIELIGYICKDPVYRTTPFKREIADILVAVNRAYNKSDYIPCIAWGRNARFAAGLPVGTKVVISGRIQSREYQKVLADGTTETRTAYEISVNRIAKGEDANGTV